MASKGKIQPEKKDDSSKSEIMYRLKTHPFLFVGTVVVLVIVIVAFVFVPAIVPGGRRGIPGGQWVLDDLVFGYYNKAPIKYVRDSYFYQVQQSLARSQQMPQDDPNYMFMIYQTWGRAYQDTVVHLGILDEVKEAGYIVPENVVDREVAKHFQENGKFAASKYRALDKTAQNALWRQVQESVISGYYISDLMGARTPSKEASFISSMASPRRSFDLAVFPFSSYPDSEVLSYAQANASLFRITRLSRITINSGEREAKQILDSVKNGVSTFEEAAKTSSQDEYAEKGGDMGIRMAHEFMAEISDEQARENVISLPKGEVSDLVKVLSGWAFFRAEEAVQPMDTNDPSQKERIRSYIMRNVRGRAEDWLMAEAEKFTAQVKEKGFDQAISEGNITRRSFGPIPLNYGNLALFGTVKSAGVPEVENAGTNQFFWKAAFSTPLKSPSNPFVFDNSVLVLYPLEESTAEESDINFIEAYYPYRINESFDQQIRSYFMDSKKLDDRFNETFGRLWSPN